MSNCWWITPTEKLARDFTFLRQDRFAAPIHCCQRMFDRSSYGNLMPPFPLSLTGVARQYSGAPSLCFRQDVYQLSQDMTQHGSHPGLLANQTPSDQYCRPIRDKLRLRRLGTDCLYVWYCFVVSMLWFLILNIRWIKCVSDSLCLYQRSEVNPELPRT